MKALLVDLDDTLLDYSGGVDDCWERACHSAAGPAGIDVALLMPALARSRRWFWDDPVRHARERTDMDGAWRQIVAHALEGMGRPSERLAAEVAEAFAANRWRRMDLYPGARETLTRLREQGMPLALVTNGDKTHQRRKIEMHRSRAVLRRHRDRGRVRSGQAGRVGVSPRAGRARRLASPGVDGGRQPRVGRGGAAAARTPSRMDRCAGPGATCGELGATRPRPPYIPEILEPSR